MIISVKVKLKVLINLLFLVFGCLGYTQEIKHFYSVDENVKLEKPVVVEISGYYNLFITDKSNLTNDFNLKKLLEEGKIFLYNDDTTFSSLANDKIKKSLGKCEDLSKNYTLKNKFIIFDLPSDISGFYFGFTTLKEYDKRMSSPHLKSYLKVTNRFYPIFFPICGE